ncbi:glycosyltransferase [Flavobacterium sp.]|uniref:glycosyltransferase n=1 Tax=Flavobacterium sp. TaxID=239 RepID=UPI00375340F3
MRILQIIDSLDIGGAEKMAVNYANALQLKVNFSGLVATRKEGDLKNQLSKDVNYLFLNRKKTFDLNAILKLKKHCKKNKIEYLQPHSSSFFTALLVKFMIPKIKIIWHDHNGLSEFLSTRKSFVLKIASLFFYRIIVVNDQLKKWAEKELYCEKVIFLPNFTTINSFELNETKLKGEDGKRILCLANLRLQKNHFFLLKVAQELIKSHSDWSFHLVGKDFNDDYSKKVFDIISSKNLQNNVFIYGSKNDINNIIKQCEIAILTSQSEGLPVAILEYGLHKKPVVSTNVGEIPLIIKNCENGFVVSKNDENEFNNSLIKLINDIDLRRKLGNSLYNTIIENHSEKVIIKNYLDWIKET